MSGIRPDVFYHGICRHGLDLDEVKKYMFHGLVKLAREGHLKLCDADDIGDVLDAWCEHDAFRQDFFDHLIEAETLETMARAFCNM